MTNESRQDKPLLTARGLCRKDPRTGATLLRDASLSLAAGERIALMGPSGSGKTLLLRSLALLDPVASGEVLWQGHAVGLEEIPRYRAQVVYVHQRATLFDGTVEDNLVRPFSLAAHRGQTYNRAHAERWLARFGRDAAFLGRKSRDLSGGEAQITAIVRVLGTQPTVLLLDEPTAALDAAAATAFAGLIDAWLAEAPTQRACVWVSHDESYLTRVTTRCVQVSGGTTREP